MSDLGIIDAVKNGDYSTAELLINKGSDVNQQDEQGWTPLNFAAGKGDLSLVKLLVEKGADIFKVGRDMRTPYMIALSAGRVSAVNYLREIEDNFPGEKPARPPQKHCKAYYLKDLRAHPGWSENRIDWKEKKEADDGDIDDKVVYIHQDLTVTESAWHGENVIFQNVDSAWEEFCVNSLKFVILPNI
jgi:uncharacterized protein